MSKINILNIAAAMLLLFAALMIYLGIANSILPPAITGAGFIVIALVFLGLKGKI